MAANYGRGENLHYHCVTYVLALCIEALKIF
ncbi:MAG: hypothetical protein K0R78_3070 [Pelosinus sp.]|nr:hypothetical protein [Pelosinus sp.]